MRSRRNFFLLRVIFIQNMASNNSIERCRTTKQNFEAWVTLSVIVSIQEYLKFILNKNSLRPMCHLTTAQTAIAT